MIPFRIHFGRLNSAYLVINKLFCIANISFTYVWSHTNKFISSYTHNDVYASTYDYIEHLRLFLLELAITDFFLTRKKSINTYDDKQLMTIFRWLVECQKMVPQCIGVVRVQVAFWEMQPPGAVLHTSDTLENSRINWNKRAMNEIFGGCIMP